MNELSLALDAREQPLSIVGIDPAWGERQPDGIARLDFPGGLDAPVASIETDLLRGGDDELLDWIGNRTGTPLAFLAMDAPTIAPNETGSRPVDRECSRIFRREEAGCHPVNRALCERPLRIAEELERRGWKRSANLESGSRLLAEVYPHPAMIRLFGLDKTLKYKRSPVANRREEFRRYRDCLRRFLVSEWPEAAEQHETRRLLATEWTKPDEDRLDAFFCAVVGWWHLRHQGERSELLGDEESGQILIPKSSGLSLSPSGES